MEGKETVYRLGNGYQFWWGMFMKYHYLDFIDCILFVSFEGMLSYLFIYRGIFFYERIYVHKYIDILDRHIFCIKRLYGLGHLSHSE